MKARILFFSLLSLLLLMSLACSRAGQILTPEEATAVARGEPLNGDPEEAGGEGNFTLGQEVVFTNQGFLVPIMKEPGDRLSYSNAARGQTATIKASREVDGTIWYQVESNAGSGWVDAKYLAAGEGGEQAAEGSTTQAAGEGAPADSTPAAGGEAEIAVGDEVTLVGLGFLLNLYEEAGSNQIIANQERGATVTVLEVTQVDDENWYRVKASGGEGWVPAENLSKEAP